MTRPVTLFTGQWADLPVADLATACAGWGFDGLELACWGDHFEVDRALADDAYCRERRQLLERHGLGCWALGAHLVGQAVCDRIDPRHQAILPPDVWGDGEEEGVRRRAAERMKDTARAAARFGVTQVNGFTGSPIWHLLYSFPPNDFAEIERGYEVFAEAWSPILDVFDAEGVRFGLEVHPTEIAYDFVTTEKTLAAHRPPPGVRHQPRPVPLRAPAPRHGRVRAAVRRPHLPRARQGLEEAARRSPVDPRLAPELRRRGTRLGLCVAGSRRRRLRSAIPGTQPDRLHRPALHRVGGLGDGSRVRRPGRSRLRSSHRLPGVELAFDAAMQRDVAENAGEVAPRQSASFARRVPGRRPAWVGRSAVRKSVRHTGTAMTDGRQT